MAGSRYINDIVMNWGLTFFESCFPFTGCFLKQAVVKLLRDSHQCSRPPQGKETICVLAITMNIRETVLTGLHWGHCSFINRFKQIMALARFEIRFCITPTSAAK